MRASVHTKAVSSHRTAPKNTVTREMPMRGFILGLGLALFVAPAHADEPKPLGAWFSGYEKLTFDDEIAWGAGAYAVSHYNSAEFYTPFRTADLGHYSAVFFGRFGGRALDKLEQSALERWVAGGGHLILSGEEGQRLFGNEPPAWLGIERWASVKPLQCTVQRPDHPLARNLQQFGAQDPAWQTTSAVAGKAGSLSVMGKDNLALLLVAEHGKGKVVYLGGALTPHKRPAYLEKQFVHDLSPLARQVWRNLFDYLGTPRRTDVIRQGAAKPPNDNKSILCWWRYQKATPLGARLYAPPCPQPGDELADLKLDMGQGERLRREFFVTSLREQNLTVTPTDLVGPDGSRIPAAACQVFIQERPLEAYTKAAYWLVPVTKSLPLAANETYTFWVVVRSPVARPGVYRGTVEFRETAGDRRIVQRLPINLQLWDVRCPDSEVLHYELEHIWFTMPGGYWIEKDRSRQVTLNLDGKPVVSIPLNNPKVLANYIRALGNLEVDFAQNWSDVDRLYPLAFLRLRSDGKLLSQEVDQHPERFRGDKLPALDFSEGYDDVWNGAIAAGMRYASVNYQIGGDGSLGLARRIARDEKLSADSDIAGKVRTWYWSEYVRYLRDRGVQGVYTKIHDEFGPDGIADFIKSARAIRAAGIKSYTTTYNFDRDQKSIVAVDPFMDVWQMAWPRQSPFELYRELKIPFEKDNEVWGTTASSFWGNGEGARAAGWLAARLRYQGIHTHGYMRWLWNDHEGCFPGAERPYDSVTMMHQAQGITEGRYLAQLIRMIDFARKTGRAAAVAGEVAREWENTLLGTEPTCLLRIRHQPGISGIDATWWTDVCVTPATFEAAKRKVLQLTLRLKQAIGPLPRDVRYGDFELVKAGKPQCRLDAGAAARLLYESVPELKAVGASDGGAAGASRVLIGTLQEDGGLRDFVQKHLDGEITAHYPRPGHYAIRTIASTKALPRTLIIVGGDRAGLEQGVRNFVRLLTAENQW